MKRQFQLLCFICVSISASAQSEKQSSSLSIPKHASIIYVKNVSFDSVVNELKKENFKIDNFVKNNIIVTKYKVLPGSLKHIALHIRYYDRTAEIMGTIFEYSSASGRMDPVITYSSFSKKAFEIMNDFAAALNGEISYEE